VVVFARPVLSDFEVVREVLSCFVDASGLVVNFAKSVTIPIRWTTQLVEQIAMALGWPVGQFPCTYLGLLLSISKL
jgi:hypothetical protein